MTKKKKQTLLIIDAHALIHRAFHALPPLTSPDGQPVNAVYGFLLLVLSALREIDPQYVAIAFDAPGKTFRHEFFKDYKANRAETVPELISQFPIVHEVVEEFGFLNFSLKGYEADDLIGTICRQYDNDGSVETIILTGDMDLLQLVDRNTKLLKPMKGVKETMLFDEALVKEKYGITPKQIIDYKGLRGDTSDNIPGVKGIGEKGATELLQKFDSVEGVYAHLEDIAGRNRKALEGQEAQALLSKRLATIALDAPIDFTLESSLLGEYNHTRIQKLFQKYGFKTLFAQLNRLPGFEVKTGMFAVDVPPQTGAQAKGNDKLAYTLADTSELQAQLVKELQAVPIIAFDTETTGLDPLQSELVGVSVSGAAGTGWYVPCPDGVVPTSIKNLLENDKLKKTGHNVKFDIKVLHHAGVQIAGVTFDTMIASFILNSASRGHGLDYLAFTECGHQMQPIEELIGKGKNQVTMKDVPIEKVSWYACEDADFSWRLYEIFSKRLSESPLQSLFDDIELPSIPVLVSMEEAGVSVDEDFLKAMSVKLHRRIKTLEKKIQQLAGQEFNVASSVQMKEVLFTVLKLPTDKIKKTKTGYSTAADELAKLRDAHPIISLIEEFRELTKLTSTYIDTLPLLINPQTQRIHTNYSQTIAATGRLSSNEPNLQNIPIRTELGREIRKAFVARRGYRLVALDYSQIELRVVAHLSGDKMMTQAFQDGEDIHTRTAAELNDVPLEEVTSDMRRRAKAVNFGILYGMGVQGIMRDSGASRDEARAFLDKYFDVHSGIKDYIDKIKEDTRRDGYAETLFGRRRPLPDINSSNRMLSAAAERAAVNMPVQGTAADLMKLAMIAVHNAIQAGKIDATMLLQVHDELVFEVHKDNVETEAKNIQTIMQTVYRLTVPLDVNVSAGLNWGELTMLSSTN